MFGAIGTCIAVNISFLTLSLRKPSIPVDSHPYESGLQYQQTIDSEQQIGKRGWSVTVKSSPFAETMAQNHDMRSIFFSITDTSGRFVELSAVTVRAVNPAHPEADTQMQLVRSGLGEWRGTNPLSAGQWLLSWTIMVNQERFSFKEKRTL